MDHGVAFDQFTDTAIQRELRLEACRFYLLVGNDVVALVRVFPHPLFDKDEFRQLFLDVLTELFLGNIGIGKAPIVDFAFHGVVVVQRMLEDTGDIAYMDVIALEVAFEEYHKAIVNRTVGKKSLTNSSMRIRGNIPNTVANRKLMALG